MFAAMCYVLRAGIPWRGLPREFGPGSSVCTRWRRWCGSGLWARLPAELGSGAFREIRSADCSHIKIHQDAANPTGGQTARAMGRTKGGFHPELAAVVDAVGRAVGLSLAPGQRYDPHARAPLAPHSAGKGVLADKNRFLPSFARTGSAPEPRCASRRSASVASITTAAATSIDTAILWKTSTNAVGEVREKDVGRLSPSCLM
jgi:hypothetical protein